MTMLRTPKGTLVVGAVVSQAVYLGSMPLLTRVVNPADFGIFSVWFSIVSFYSVLVNSRLDTAIIGESSQQHASSTAALSLLLLPVWLLIYLATAIAYPQAVDGRFSLALAGILMLAFAAWHQVLRPLAIRADAYMAVSQSSGLQGMLRALSPLLLISVVSGPLALAAGEMLGRLGAALRIGRPELFQKSLYQRASLASAFARNASLMKFGLPSAVLDTVNFLLFIPFFAQLFGFVEAGLAALALRLVSAPYALLGPSFADVFHWQLSQALTRNENPMPLFWRTVRQLVMVAIPAHLLIGLAAYAGFGWVFGADWSHAGSYAAIMAIYWSTTYVTSPLSRALLITRSFRAKLWFDLWGFLVCFGALFLASPLGSFRAALAYAVVKVLCDLLYFLLIRRELRRFYLENQTTKT